MDIRAHKARLSTLQRLIVKHRGVHCFQKIYFSLFCTELENLSDNLSVAVCNRARIILKESIMKKSQVLMPKPKIRATFTENATVLIVQKPIVALTEGLDNLEAV